MIEINLLPGAGRKARGRGASGAGLGAAFSGAAAQIKDPYLLFALGATSLAVLLVAGLFWTQNTAEAAIDERRQVAVQDSVKYATVLREKRAAESRRDSVLKQLDIIRSIDNNRFVWPHIMDEVSRVLPAYTWLTAMNQTSAMPSPQDVAAADSAKGDSLAVVGAMKFRIVGNTVDIQALTRFMKDLEASAFIQNVVLDRSSLKVEEGKEVTEFQLSAEYQTPDSSAIRLAPINLSVR